MRNMDQYSLIVNIILGLLIACILLIAGVPLSRKKKTVHDFLLHMLPFSIVAFIVLIFVLKQLLGA